MSATDEIVNPPPSDDKPAPKATPKSGPSAPKPTAAERRAADTKAEEAEAQRLEALHADARSARLAKSQFDA